MIAYDPAASPAARLYVALTPSATRKFVPEPVVSGVGSTAPYVLPDGFVVQVAGRFVIVKSAAEPGTNV